MDQTKPDVAELIERIKLNEDILRRIDMIEEFLLQPHGFEALLSGVCQKTAEIFGLEAVSLALSDDLPGLAEALGRRRPPTGCFICSRKDMRLLVADLEQPFLSNNISRDSMEFLFGGTPGLASVAVLPLWARGRWLGSFNLASSQRDRYYQGLGTDFVVKLARKLSVSLEAALVHERNRLMERRQATMEMAGAACHELAQPLTSLGLKLETMLRKLDPDHPLRGDLEALRAEADRVGSMVRRIGEINEYKTRPYAQGMSIIDLQAAGMAEDG